MEVKGVLSQAQIEPLATAGEAASNKARGIAYFNYETNEFLIGTGTDFTRIKSSYDAVGDVKTSMLTEVQYQSEMDSTWVLADGRNVAGSDYQSITGSATIPDLRGKFLRGKNNGRNPYDGNANPNGDLALGVESVDMLKGHTHNVRFFGSGAGPSQIPCLDNLFAQAGQYGATETSSSDTETAPRHTTVNYFIKINRT